jgi:DNA modification methylase
MKNIAITEKQSEEALTQHLNIVYQDIDSLKLRANNPRTHSDKQVKQIANSISQFGFTNPILIDEQNIVIAGHGRIAAAKTLRMLEVPTIYLAALSDAEIRAYVIADNKLAENAGWDMDILAIEFQELINLDLDFDITLTGFDTAEIDLLIEPVNDDEFIDDIPLADTDKSPVTELGDVWILGQHRILCADATKQQSYERLLRDEKANLIFTDPPYNVPIQGHVSGLGKVQHKEFQMASGEMTQADFTEFLRGIFQNLIQHSASGSIHYVCMDWRHLKEILSAGESYAELKNICVWVKNNGGMGSLYRSQHELVLVFKNGTAPHINNVELGKHGRYRTNVWQYAGANSFHEGRIDELSMHPTVKPIAMVKDAILDCSNHDDIVLDPFGGSGTTLLAAEQSSRRAFLMELEPFYVDVTLKRFLKMTDIEPVLESTGQTFTEVATQKGCLSNTEPDTSHQSVIEKALNASPEEENAHE